MNNQTTGGTLFVVATPIGNLDDITLRALQILRAADCILAEDTRHTAILLRAHNIAAKMESFHQHNQAAKLPRVLRRLASGDNLALVSDAGTPLISDPGAPLVAAARAMGLQVCPVPGACAAVAALSVAAQDTRRFCFEGFLPRAQNARERYLHKMKHESRTMLFYETAARVHSALESLANVFGGDRQITIARELTKKFETFYCGDIEKVRAELAAEKHCKGELVLVISGAEENSDAAEQRDRAVEIMRLLTKEMPRKRAAKIAAQILSLSANELYALDL